LSYCRSSPGISIINLFIPIFSGNTRFSPFDKVGIVPVRYKSELADTIFADQYYEEKFSAYLDNINLLYVAFTRAVNASSALHLISQVPEPDCSRTKGCNNF